MAAQKKKQININLVVKEGFDESYSGQVLSWALTYGRYIIIITQIVVLSVFFLRFRIDRDHTDLKESVAQKQALVESVSELETEIRRIQGKLIYIKQITKDQDSYLKALRFLQDNTPTDMIFSVLTLSPEKMSITASSGNLKSFSYFLKKIQLDKKFTEVSLEDISRKADGRIEFKISCRININEFN